MSLKINPILLLLYFSCIGEPFCNKYTHTDINNPLSHIFVYYNKELLLKAPFCVFD